MSRRLAVVTVLAAMASATALCGAPSALAAEFPSPGLPADHLTVTVRDSGDPAADGVHRLYCHPAGGDHIDAEAACDTLDKKTTWGTEPFAPVPRGAACTLQYGGPATAHLTGTWAGRRVDARFDRRDGCEIHRWDALAPLLPRVTY